MNSCCVSAYFNQGFIVQAKPLHEVEHHVTSHDLGETSYLTFVFFHFAKQQSICLLVEDGPRLSTTVRGRLVHQDFRKFDFLRRYFRVLQYEVCLGILAILLVIFPKFLDVGYQRWYIKLTLSVAAFGSVLISLL